MHDDVLKLLKIEDVISEYVTIQSKSKSDDYRCLCPFHLDKNPSFRINPEKQLFYCYGCKAGGNLIKFVSLIENITEEESRLLLREKAGIKDESSLLNVLEQVAQYYESKRNKIHDYFYQRHIGELTQQTYRLGYASDNLFELANEFSSYKEELRELGLIKTKFANTPSEMNLSFFSNRLIFPITNQYGVVGFVGRTLIDDQNKYLNSFDNKYFKRRYTLYGLTKESIKEIYARGFVYLVEGMVDVQRMQIRDYLNTVGGLGTGLTIEQAKLIKRFTEKVVLLYDGDDAGRKASLTTAKILLQVGLRFRVAFLLDGEDPDSYLLKYKILEDVDVEDGFYYLTNRMSRDEFITLVKESENHEIIPDRYFKFYKVMRSGIQSKPMRYFNQSKIKQINPAMHFTLFLDAFPEFIEGLPDHLVKLFLENKGNTDLINLYFKNPYKNIKDSKIVFETMKGELEKYAK